MIKFIGKTAGKLYDKVWSRSKSPNRHQVPNSDDFYITKRKLPANFAEQLLNLEIDLEQGNYSIMNINKLLELYSAAIEYYESIISNKHYIFQNKLKNLMANPRVIEEINEEFRRNNKDKDPIKLSQKEKAENFHQEYLKNAVKELHVNEFRQSLSDKIATVEGLISGQISIQQKLILKRLEERKNKFNSKSQPPSSRITEEDERTPVFSKKKDESPKFKGKNKEESVKLKKSLYKEEENRKTEESPNGKIQISHEFKISQELKVEEKPKNIRKLSRVKKSEDIAYKIMSLGVSNAKQQNSPMKNIETSSKEQEKVREKEKSPKEIKDTRPKKKKDSNPAFRLIKKNQK